MQRSYSRFQLENGTAQNSGRGDNNRLSVRSSRSQNFENAVPLAQAIVPKPLVMGRSLAKPVGPSFPKPTATALGQRPLSAQSVGLRDITNLANAGNGKGSSIVSLHPSKPQLCSSKTAVLHDTEGPRVEPAGDPQHVQEYLGDVYQCWKREELQLLPVAGYMGKQVHITPKMRSILVDWLVDVHKKYKLRAETLFLAISLIDRYLVANCSVKRGTLQLVGVTAMLIASKYEERHPPKVKDYVYITDRAYTQNDVIEMEATLLASINFQLCAPTAVNFLDRYQSFNGPTGKHCDLSAFLLELSLVEYEMLQYTPSLLAAAALFVSNSLLQRSPPWTEILATQTEYESHSLQGCSKDLRELLQQCSQSRLHSVFKKFSQPAFNAIAQLACSLVND